jgi:hypothetical protein
MAMKLRQFLVPAAALLLVWPMFTVAQTQPQPSSAAKATARKATKTNIKPPLASLTLVSTDEMARNAAEETLKKAKAQEHGAKPTSASKPSPTDVDAVMEFHPAAAGSQAGSAAYQTKDKKSALKNLHGDAYGISAGARGSGEGGEAGAESTNGKYSIYVGAEHSRASPAPSH